MDKDKYMLKIENNGAYLKDAILFYLTRTSAC